MQIKVTPDHKNIRLDHFLNEEMTETSRNQIQRLIKEGHITINSAPSKKNYKLQIGDKIKVVIPELKPSPHKPQDLLLDIIYEDKDLIAINKPAGISVHPRDQRDQTTTIVNALLAHCGKDLSGIGGVLRPGIVHRLDKDTSGVLLVAKNDKAHQALSKQFSERTIKKWYTALAAGRITPKQGKIDAPIARHRVERKKMTISNNGKAREAITEYKVEDTGADDLGIYSVCRIRIHTGRTHQIRVHLQAIGHPVIGDTTYGVKKYNDHFAKHYGLKRQFLHASEIEFTLPSTNKKINLKAPLPDDLAKTLPQL